jgi:hypothetical protein
VVEEDELKRSARGDADETSSMTDERRKGAKAVLMVDNASSLKKEARQAMSSKDFSSDAGREG